jgi:hypothetical protein
VGRVGRRPDSSSCATPRGLILSHARVPPPGSFASNRCVLNAHCGLLLEAGAGGDVRDNELASGNGVGLKVVQVPPLSFALPLRCAGAY